MSTTAWKIVLPRHPVLILCLCWQVWAISVNYRDDAIYTCHWKLRIRFNCVLRLLYCRRVPISEQGKPKIMIHKLEKIAWEGRGARTKTETSSIHVCPIALYFWATISPRSSEDKPRQTEASIYVRLIFPDISVHIIKSVLLCRVAQVIAISTEVSRSTVSGEQSADNRRNCNLKKLLSYNRKVKFEFITCVTIKSHHM